MVEPCAPKNVPECARFGVVLGEGFEPPRACAQWLLRPSRLPVPPAQRHYIKRTTSTTSATNRLRVMEANFIG